MSICTMPIGDVFLARPSARDGRRKNSIKTLERLCQALERPSTGHFHGVIYQCLNLFDKSDCVAQ
jgi:hypothetical protein